MTTQNAIGRSYAELYRRLAPLLTKGYAWRVMLTSQHLRSGEVCFVALHSQSEEHVQRDGFADG